MEGRGSGLGCIVAVLGLVLCILLLPYLISSVYSVANALWQAGGAANWLWGDWINSWVGGDRTLYMLLSEGPMCCAGAVALLILSVGALEFVGARQVEEEHETGDEFDGDAAQDAENAPFSD